MPKVLVLFFGAESPAVSLAEAAAEGARSVRFAEVDIRAWAGHPEPASRPYRQLEKPDVLPSYDGIVLACPAAGELPVALDHLLADLEQRSAADAFTNVVFAVIGGETTLLLARVARLGGIIVSEPRGNTDPEVRATQLGARAAKVVGWVRHGLSHEHGHHHH